MKHLSDDVFQLIHSLGGQEKRYFKLFASRNIKNGKNNYLLLFDVIDRQKAYDESKVKKAFANTSFAKHLPVKKIYLTKLILKSLGNYYSEISIEAKMKNYLREIEIVFKKGLYTYCEKLIAKAKKAAYDYELYEDCIVLMKWERKVLIKNSYYEPAILMKHLEERSAVIERIKRLNHIRSLQDEMFGIYLKRGVMRTKEDVKQAATIIHELDQLGDGSSFNEKVAVYYTHSHYYALIDDPENKFRKDQMMVDLLETHPHRIKEDINTYVTVLNNLITSCTSLRLEKMFYHYLLKLKMVPRSFSANVCFPEIEAKIFEMAYIGELYFCNVTGNFEKGISLVPEVEAGIKKFQAYGNNYLIKLLHDNIACLYFYKGDYRNALRWHQKIFETGSTDERDDVICFAKLFNLIIHYELGNKDLLEYAIKSTHRFLQKRNKIYKLESIFLHQMKKIIQLDRQDEVIASFKILRQKLLPLLDDPFEKHAFKYFDFITWIECKIENKTFKEITEKNLR